MNRIAGLVLLVAGSTACSLGPAYRRPAVAVPPAFRAAEPGPAESLANLKWFDLFQDAALQSLIRQALAGNYDLRIAAARVEQAQAGVGLNRANQFPNLNGTSDLTLLRNSRAGAFPLPETVGQNRTFGNLGLTLLSFEVDLWGRLRKLTEAAQADLLASEQARRAVVTALVAEVAASYFTLVALDQELAIVERTLQARRESLRLVQVRQAGGVATLLDVRQAEQLVYAAAQSVPDTQRQIEQTENRLRLLTGMPPGAIERGVSLADQRRPAEVPAGLPAALLERRPDIRAAEESLHAADARIAVARAAYFPRIALTGSAGYQSNQLGSLFSSETGIWQFVPQVSQPIFQAGRLGANLRLSRATRQEALVRYEQTIQTAFREVADALIQYRRIQEVLTQQTALVETLQDRSRLAYRRYRGGVDTYLNALDADRDLFSAELSLTRSRREQLNSVVQIYKALGGGWE